MSLGRELVMELPNSADLLVSEASFCGRPAEHIDQRLGFTGAVLSLLISMIGAGVVAFPFAFRLGGLSVSVTLLFVMVMFAHEAYLCVLRCCKITGISSYDHMISTLPPHWKRASNASLFFLLILACTSYVIVARDTSKVVIEEFCGKSRAEAVPHFVLSAAVVIVNIPLGCVRTLRGLSIVTTACFAGLLIITFLLVWQAIEQRLEAQPESKVVQSTDFIKLVCSLPIYATSNFGHMNFPRIYAELRPDLKPNAASVSLVACGISALIYGSIGAAGYCAFGGSVQSDIILEFSAFRQNTVINVVQAILLAFVVAKMPLLIFPLRAQVLSLVSPKQTLETLTWGYNIGLTVALCGVIFLFAVISPDLGLVMDILGALCCVPLTFIVPARLAIQNRQMADRRSLAWRSYGLGGIGVLISWLSLYAVFLERLG
eukprot:TRINITY_DN8817_c0_g1_i1.p1 TRINITY_DN8817_c0_g1~~TRINITY_DN8817_c0_g1_i1.p1  ORF type:complete len:431 (-),score=45.87 TRINITY_DN8817_c0_g1_i1:157-1449(-)